MSQYVADTSAPVPIERYEQLVGYFEAACKPRAQWRIGTEYEKVAVWAASGHAVPFTGGIEEVLRRLAERFPWEPILEDGRVVVGVRPEAFVVADGAPADALVAEPRPDTREALGSETLVQARLGHFEVSVRLFGPAHVLPDRVAAPAAALHLFSPDGPRIAP